MVLHSCGFGNYCGLVSDEWRLSLFIFPGKQLHHYVRRNEMTMIIL